MMNDGSMAWGWGSGMMGTGFLFMLFFWALVILGIAALIKLLMGRGGGARKDPLEVLRERYARGDISREQFEQMNRDLTQK